MVQTIRAPLGTPTLFSRLLHFRFIPIVLAICWLVYANVSFPEHQQLTTNLLNTLLGLVGAIFANLSGAGGGVVFIPVFNHLGLSGAQAVSTSFGIQSFGMTAGAITWSLYYLCRHRHDPKWISFVQIILLVGVTSALGIWAQYLLAIGGGTSLAHQFSWFSIALGLSLLIQIYWIKIKADNHSHLKSADYVMLSIIGFFGGIITALLSVGVGEILVLYLIFRGFCVTMAIASAVVVTAITVWAAAPIHLGEQGAAVWDVVMYAGPSAIIGGIIASTIATYINTKALKTVLGLWILVMGLVG